MGDEIVPALESSDSITLNLLAGDDTVLITAATPPAPATFAQGDGVFEVETTAGDLVPTTTVNWVGHIAFTIANTGLASNDHDLLDDPDARRQRRRRRPEPDDRPDPRPRYRRRRRRRREHCDLHRRQPAPTRRGVSEIDAPLVVNGGAGTNSLDLDDTVDTTGDTLVLTSSLSTASTCTRTASATLGIGELDIRLGSGGDT